jgi:hypothetical protein
MTIDIPTGTFELNQNTNEILAGLMKKVPLINENVLLRANVEEKTTLAIQTKLKELLSAYAETDEKLMIIKLISETVAAGCIAFRIDPVELIIKSRATQPGEQHIAMAERKVVGPFDIKFIAFDPEQIMFRVQILIQIGDSTAKNITDLLFVIMHEMAHLAQSILAEAEVEISKQIEYSCRPTEIHADLVALEYCKVLYNAILKAQITSREVALLQIGLPQTIQEAEEHRRPKM